MVFYPSDALVVSSHHLWAVKVRKGCWQESPKSFTRGVSVTVHGFSNLNILALTNDHITNHPVR